jgi:hypothetical protein
VLGGGEWADFDRTLASIEVGGLAVRADRDNPWILTTSQGALVSTSLPLCVSLFYVIDTGSIRPRARIKARVTELGVTYLPFALSSDASCATYP